MTKAESLYNSFSTRGEVFSWEDKSQGAFVLLAKITGEDKYKNNVKNFCENVRNSQTTSPKGEKYFYEWGSLRYAANAALICLQVFLGNPTTINNPLSDSICLGF